MNTEVLQFLKTKQGLFLLPFSTSLRVPSSLSWRYQKELCEETKVKNKKGIVLNVGASDLSRIVTKLEEYGYVKRKSSAEGELVHLNIWPRGTRRTLDTRRTF